MEVQFSGMELDAEQRSLVNGYSDRFCKGCDVKALHINIKGHKKAGGRMSYTVQLRAEIPRHGLKTAEDTSWDFHAAVKTAFAKLHKEVKPMPRGLIRRLLARRGEIGV